MGSNTTIVGDFNQMTLDDKLSTIKYEPDINSHLNPDFEQCKICKSKICNKICPAGVYEWLEDEKKLLVKYENCLECGACRIACEKKCINWEYPKGTKGVIFKRG